MSIDGILKGHDLFRSLNFDQTHLISGFSSLKKIQGGEIIFQYGNPASHVFMLIDGTVSLRLPAESQDFSLVISKIEKGELFGLSPLLGSSRYTATGICNADSEILFIEAQPFLDLLKRNCPVGFNIMNQVAHIYFHRYINVLKNLQGVVNQVSLIR